jgi:hypothetical protein
MGSGGEQLGERDAFAPARARGLKLKKSKL